MVATRGGRAYERYSWITLLMSAALGLLAGPTLTFAPLSIMVEPAFAVGNVPGVLRALGLTWVFFNVFVLIVLFRNLQAGRGERGGSCGCCRFCGCSTSSSTRPPSTPS